MLWASVTALQIPCIPPVRYSPASPLELMATTDVFIVSMVLPLPECRIAGIIQYAAFSYWLPSNMHLMFLHVFHGLIAHSFVLLNSIPLCCCTTVYLSIRLLKDTLVASIFWQL